MTTLSDTLPLFTLPPLPDISLPPLPVIENTDIRRLVFTHSSLHGKLKKPLELEYGAGYENLDYEKLEHFGDALLELHVTTLLEDMFPNFKPGPATILRSLLVNNATLSQISVRYSLPDQLRANPSTFAVVRTQPKIQAALFEAFVAGVYQSFRSFSNHETGISSPRSHGEAYDHLDKWLRPLFTPLATFAVDCLKAEQSRLRMKMPVESGDPDDDALALGSTAALNQYSQTKCGRLPQYVEDCGGLGGPWNVSCTMVVDGRQWSASATRESIKAAKTVAAWKVRRLLGI